MKHITPLIYFLRKEKNIMKKCKRIIAALMVAMMVILCGNQNLILAQSTSSIVITAQP